MKAVKAYSKDFFDPGIHPIRVIKIHGSNLPQHAGDLTGIRHFHDFAELVIITEGYGVHWIDGTDYPVAAGDVFLLQGKTEHYFKERHNLVLYNIMHDSFRLRQYLKNLQSDAGYNAMFLLEPNYRKRHKFRSRLHVERKSLAHIDSIMQKMTAEQDTKFSGYDTLMLCMLLELIVFFSREYSKIKIPQAQALYKMGKVIGKLETGYLKNWSIAELSKLAGMSKSSLMTAFREATGHTPLDYLIRIRLQKAAEMLVNTNLPISEIAPESGFADSNYLTRQFKKVYSTGPREYRKNNL